MKDRDDRLVERLRQLGTDTPECTNPDCDERNPFALTGVYPDILCYECRAIVRGKPWMEDDHFAGQHNDPGKSLIPANDHRIRSERQVQEWPRETLRNPDRSPLLWAAARQRGVRDYLELVLDRYSPAVAELLESLDVWLRERIGERWFEAFREESGWEKP